jgi:DNA polymerase-3 subunit delta
MILKSFSINYEKLVSDFNIILFYGENFHLKNELIDNLFKELLKKKFTKKILNEDDIAENSNILFEHINLDNLFEEKEVICINDCSDKILEFFDFNDLIENDKKIILTSNNLTKKSKLRNLAEKEGQIACIPCYDDDDLQLQNLLKSKLKELKIDIESSLVNELFSLNKLNRLDINEGIKKIELISQNKKIDRDILNSLFNTTSSFDVFEISNILLNGDKKNLNKVLESFYHFSINFNELLPPLKYKINKLVSIYESNTDNKNLSSLIDNFKPPIFWKEKKTIQSQLTRWKEDELKILMRKINDIEILCKQNYEIAETIFNKFLLDIISKRVLVNTYL